MLSLHRSFDPVGCPVVVRAQEAGALRAVLDAAPRHGYRLSSTPGTRPLTLERGSVGSFAVLGMGVRPAGARSARWSVLHVVPSGLPDGLLHLAFQVLRAQQPREGRAAAQALLSELVRGWHESDELVGTGAWAPLRTGLHTARAWQDGSGREGGQGAGAGPSDRLL